MTELYRSEHWIVTRDPLQGLYKVVRTSARAEDLVAFEADMERIAKLLPKGDRTKYVLLADLREAPMRSDPEFETMMRRTTAKIFHGWARSAMLVKTAVGKLQVTRATRETGSALPVFSDEAEALAFLAKAHAAVR